MSEYGVDLSSRRDSNFSLLDENNTLNCETCPYNKGMSAWPETRKPCGQFDCWVQVHCDRAAALEEEEEE